MHEGGAAPDPGPRAAYPRDTITAWCAHNGHQLLDVRDGNATVRCGPAGYLGLAVYQLRLQPGLRLLLLTGGEPFLLPDIAELAQACTKQLHTTLPTNGMLFRDTRLQRLRAMDRTRLSPHRLDSSEPILSRRESVADPASEITALY